MIPDLKGAEWQWRKSSRSNNVGGDCVEFCRVPVEDEAAVRDSKNPGPVLRFSPAAWVAFVATARRS